MNTDHMSENLLDSALRLAGQTAFPFAVRTYCVEVARLWEAPLLLNALIATEARWRILGYLLYLASDTERFGPCGGATYGRLLSLCTRHKEAGPRVLKTFLGMLKLASLVKIVPDKQDGRIHYYQPTAKLNSFATQWASYALATLDLLEGSSDRSCLLNDPQFLRRFNVSGGRAHLADVIPLLDRMPEPLARLNSMLGSFATIIGLMEADLCGHDTPSVASLARRFGLSRGQVRNVITSAYDHGLLISQGNTGMQVTPVLHENMSRWISIELAFYARHMRPAHELLPPVIDDIF